MPEVEDLATLGPGLNPEPDRERTLLIGDLTSQVELARARGYNLQHIIEASSLYPRDILAMLEGRDSHRVPKSGLMAARDAVHELARSGVRFGSSYEPSEAVSVDSTRLLQNRIDVVQRSMDKLLDVVAQAKPPAADGAVADLAKSISDQLKGASLLSRDLTAPVMLPTAQQMQVRLVPSHQLDRLHEYQGDASIIFTFAGLFLGAVLGVFTNLQTGGKAGSSTGFFVVLFGVLAIATAVYGALIKYRAAQLRKDIESGGRPTKDEAARVLPELTSAVVAVTSTQAEVESPGRGANCAR